MIWNWMLMQDLTSRSIWLKRPAIGRTKTSRGGSINSPVICCFDMVEDENEEVYVHPQTFSTVMFHYVEAEIAAVVSVITFWHSDPLQTHFAADFAAGSLVDMQADCRGNRNCNHKLLKSLCTECVSLGSCLSKNNPNITPRGNSSYNRMMSFSLLIMSVPLFIFRDKDVLFVFLSLCL